MGTTTQVAPTASHAALASAPISWTVNKNLVPESDRKYSISRALSSGFIGTATAPASSIPKKWTGNAGTFGSTRPTRSPGWTPCWVSQWATAEAWACSSA